MSLQSAVELHRRGLMLILSSPSGAGKTTLSRRILEQYKNAPAHEAIVMSVSVTTRAMRVGEVQGKDYFFVDEPTYKQMVERGEMLEHARVFDHYYGTPAAFVREHIEKGVDVLFDIDWQGTKQLAEQNRKNAQDNVVSIFILPPSMDELERRLRARAQDSDEVVAKRMSKARSEISHWQEYDFVLINQDLDQTHEKINSILKAERLKRTRQDGLADFIKNL